MDGACFMFGHATCPETILPRLERAIEACYSNRICFYYVGNRGQFDRFAATAVKRVKQKHPDIRLYLVLAYHPTGRALTDGFDNSYYPPLENTPKQFAIVKANRYMIDTADSIICYANHIGNSRNLLEYAQQRKKQIINVAELSH